jgi:hypothetical protein
MGEGQPTSPGDGADWLRTASGLPTLVKRFVWLCLLYHRGCAWLCCSSTTLLVQAQVSVPSNVLAYGLKCQAFLIFSIKLVTPVAGGRGGGMQVGPDDPLFTGAPRLAADVPGLLPGQGRWDAIAPPGMPVSVHGIIFGD